MFKSKHSTGLLPEARPRLGPDIRPPAPKWLGASSIINKGAGLLATRLLAWTVRHKASSSSPQETPSSGPPEETSTTTRGTPSPRESTNAAGPAAAAAVENPNPGDKVATLIEGKMRGTPRFSPDCAIYQVPDRFRNGNEQHYKPRVVSIGPYHSHDGSFPQMQSYKYKYVEAFTSRNDQVRPNELKFMEQCLAFVRLYEARARSYYVEPIDLSSDDFVRLILVDAIFILELMLRHQFAQYIDDGDRIYHKPRMIADVFLDVVLLIENQIPFFLLEGLYDLVDSSCKENFSFFVDLTHEFFRGYIRIDELRADHAPVPQVNHGVKHFVDFIRHYYLPPSPVEGENHNRPRVDEISPSVTLPREGENPNSHPRVEESPPSVTVLDDCGVQFVTGRTTFLLDIKFNNGRLIIPNFRVHLWTETLFRNLIAFEQCHDHPVKYISQFMFFMGGMIKTSKDVDLLIEHGIISSMLGSNDDLSALFTRIAQGVTVDLQTYYYHTLSHRLNDYCKAPLSIYAYCKARWHRWKEILHRDYFDTPWKLASTIAAIILLVLTLIQTICSILSLKVN